MSASFVVVSTGGEAKLLRVPDVQEIVPSMTLAEVERPKGACRGILHLRGQLVPVFDLSGPGAILSPSRFIVVCTADEHAIGLVVDDVRGVVTVPMDDVMRRPIGGGHFAALARVDGEILPVLEPSDVLSAPE